MWKRKIKVTLAQGPDESDLLTRGALGGFTNQEKPNLILFAPTSFLPFSERLRAGQADTLLFLVRQQRCTAAGPLLPRVGYFTGQMCPGRSKTPISAAWMVVVPNLSETESIHSTQARLCSSETTLYVSETYAAITCTTMYLTRVVHT